MQTDPLGTGSAASFPFAKDFAKVLSVLVNGAGINPSGQYMIDYFRIGLHIAPMR